MVESLLAVAAATGDEASVAAVVGQITGDADMRHAELAMDYLWRVLWTQPIVDNWLSVQNCRRRRSNKSSRITQRPEKHLVPTERTRNSRIAAIQLIGRVAGPATQSLIGKPVDDDVEQLTALLGTRFPPAVQSAAVQGLARLAGANAPRVLLARWSDATPRLRAEMLDALLAQRVVGRVIVRDRVGHGETWGF